MFIDLTKVVDPWGKILLDLGREAPQIGTVEIDLNLIDEIKLKMPIEEHRREDLYSLKCFHQISPSQCRIQDDGQNFHPNIRFVLVEINDQYDENIRWGQVEISSKQIFYRTKFSFATVNKKPVVNGRRSFCHRNDDEIVSFCFSRSLRLKMFSFLLFVVWKDFLN